MAEKQNAYYRLLEKKMSLQREERRRRYLALVSAMLSFVVMIISSFAFLKFKTLPDFFAPSNDKIFTETVKALNNQISSLELQMAQLRSVPFAPTNLTPNIITGAAIAEVSMQVSNLNSRIKSLEDAITASPDKALAIPMLRKDLDVVQKNQTDKNAEVKAELERLYDFNKWFFGLIATMALSTVGLAVANAFKVKKENKETQPDEQ